jgi:hypothetical protein
MQRSALLHSVARVVHAEVRSCLEQAGIPSLPVKGLVTGFQLYAPGDPREISDVDLRVRPEDFARAERAFVGAGFRIRLRSAVYRNLVLSVGGLDVDVETACGPPGFTTLDVATMMRRAVRLEGEGAALGLVPEIHDHGIFLVVNAVKDHLTGAMPWAIEDLRRLIRLPAVSPAILRQRAVTAHAAGMLRLVARYLDTEPRWAALADSMDSGFAFRAALSDAHLALLRRGGPRLAVRIASRAACDGPLRATTSLARAALWEVESAVGRARAGRRRPSS